MSDYMVLGIGGRLHIIADDATVVAAGRHRPGDRIGERDLPTNFLELAKPTTQRRQSLD
jgi:hypothetical protein